MSKEAWAALWSEFGFGTPDAAGCRGASHTQLTGALSCTEGKLSIDSALQSGILYRETVVDEFGTEIPGRYRLAVGGTDV